MRIPSGKTDQVIYFVAVDPTDLKTRETGLSSFTVYRSRNGGAATVYTTPTVTELSAANMPGVYSLLIDEDTTVAAGSDSEEYCVHITQASMQPVTRTIELYRRDTTTGTTITTSNIDAAISSRMASYTQPTGFLAATFPATVASTTNITAGTITTATNVTTVNGLAANVITAASINTGAITAAKFAAGAIDAAAIATGAIDADALATDAVTEIWAGSTAPSAATIADAVWDEDATAHQTQGTFGQAIGDPVADTNTIYKAVVTDATGATVGVDVVAMKVDTAAILDDTGTAGVVVAAGSKTGYSLTATTGLGNQTADITGNLSGSVGSVTGAVGSVTGNVGGNVVGSVASVTAAVSLTAGAVDAIWDEATSGHTTAGTTGKALIDAGSAGDPWSTALPGAYGAGTAGKIVGDNLNATVGSRASQASLDTLDDFVDTEVAAIKAKTDSLTFTVAGQVDANIHSVNDVTVTGTGAPGNEWGP